MMLENEKGLGILSGIAQRLERSNGFKSFLGFYDKVSRFGKTLRVETKLYEKLVRRSITPVEAETLERYLRAKHVEAARGWFLIIPVYVALMAMIAVLLLMI